MTDPVLAKGQLDALWGQLPLGLGEELISSALLSSVHCPPSCLSGPLPERGELLAKRNSWPEIAGGTHIGRFKSRPSASRS